MQRSWRGRHTVNAPPSARMEILTAASKPSDSGSTRIGLQVRDRQDDRSRRHGTRPRALQLAEILGGGRLLAMPLLRNVLNSRFAGVVHQYEGQSICVRTAKLIHARASAIFGDGAFLASLLNCHGVASNRISAPDLCLRLCNCSVKRSVGIDGPNRA